MNERKETLMRILQIIANAEEPLGSGTISQELVLYDCDISEATVGRVLREMDLENLTERVGYRGRLLTEKGLAYLRELQEDQQRQLYGHEFIRLSRVQDKDELLNILVARKAIEKMTARLAALYATEEDIKKLQQVVQVKARPESVHITVAEHDVQFHKIIARASKNPILESALNVIRQDGQLSPIMEYIRMQVGGNILNDHLRILRSIEERYPDMAEKAMGDHLDSLIEDVNKYWELVHLKNQANGSA